MDAQTRGILLAMVRNLEESSSHHLPGYSSIQSCIFILAIEALTGAFVVALFVLTMGRKMMR